MPTMLKFDPMIAPKAAPTPAVQVQGAELDPLKPAKIATATPFKTNLILEESRRRWLCEQIRTRIEECRREMGWSASSARTGQPTEFTLNSWLWKRANYQQQYDNEFDWRKGKYGGIFEDSNWSMNMCKRFIRLMAAKMSDDLLGTEPFFAAMPQRPGANEQLAKQLEEFIVREVGRSNVRESLKESQRVALIRNEATIKVTYVRNATPFIGPAKVMCGPWVDAFSGREFGVGEPLQTASGNYIYENDDVVPDKTVNGQFRLRKEPSFVMPPVGALPVIEFDDLEQVLVEYEGVDAAVLDFRDFIFPIRCRTLADADLKVHVYDETFERLQALYSGFQIWNDYLSRYESESKKARPEKGEIESASRVLKLLTVFEGVFKCDADQDGYEEQIFFAYDWKNDELAFYDYLGNHMKTSPFVMIPGVEKVEGRAYGVGIYELLDHKTLYVDMMFNRVNYKSSKDGSVTFKVAGGIKEEANGIPLIIGSKHIYECNQGFDEKNPPVFRKNLAEVDEHGLALMEKMIQSGQLEVGIISAAEGSSADLNTSETAAGVHNIERTGNVLQNDTEQLHAARFTEVLRIAVDVVFENMQENEVFYTAEGSELATLNRDEVRGLERDVRLLLTKARSSESLEMNAQADAIVDKYYQRPKWLQKLVRQFAVNQLKALDVTDADTVLKEPTDEEIKAEAEASKDQQGKPMTSSESISIKLSDLLPSERVQALAKVKIRAGTPEELVHHEQMQAKLKTNARPNTSAAAKPGKAAPGS